MDVSWHLLRPAERRALADLSVFRGGFRKAAAHAVAGVDAARLAALVDAALVHVLPKRRARVWPSRPPSWDDSTMGWSSCGRTSPCAIATPPWPVMTRGCNGRSRCPPARRTKCWRWSPGRGAYAAAREHPWVAAGDLHCNYAWNIAQYCNPELDALVEEALVSLDQDRRQELYDEFFTFVQEESFYVAVGHLPAVFIARPEVEGVRIVGGRLLFNEARLE